MRKNIMTWEKSSQKDSKQEKLPFAKNEVTRLMKANLDADKMIKDQVKVEMNRFLYSILVNVCRRLNEYPYTTVDYEMFRECVYPYTNIERINEEKQRIVMHLDAIKTDCDALAMDVEKSLRLKDTAEKDFTFDFSGSD
jgi:histone H3/H4